MTGADYTVEIIIRHIHDHGAPVIFHGSTPAGPRPRPFTNDLLAIDFLPATAALLRTMDRHKNVVEMVIKDINSLGALADMNGLAIPELTDEDIQRLLDQGQNGEA